MPTPNLASIEYIFDEIIDFTIGQDKIPYKSWYPELQRWRSALQGGCRELNGFDSVISEDFKSKKQKIKDLLLSQKEELMNFSIAIGSLKDKEILLGVYEEIIEEIDNLNDLYCEDIYVILYVTMEKFLEKLALDNYTEFYELNFLDDAKRTGEPILSNKQYAWIFHAKGEDTSRGNIINLIEKYKIRGKALDIKKNIRFYQDCLEVGKEYKELYNARPIKSKESTKDDLLLVI